VSAWQKPWLSL